MAEGLELDDLQDSPLSQMKKSSLKVKKKASHCIK